jgi:probable HAF family extracellular repeat protein
VKARAFAAALALLVLLLSSAQAATQRQARYTVRDLGTLGGTITAAADVNALGQVVGFSMTADGFLHAFRWSKGKMTDLGTLGGQASYATAVNDAGMVVGYSQLAGSQDSHAFLWQKRTGMRDLGTLGGAQSFASDVNDLGLVVGRAFDSTQTPHGFAWTAKTGMRGLAGNPFSSATAAGAGSTGPVVGWAGVPLVPGSWSDPAAPFVPFPLPSGFLQGQANGVDARGDTVGTMGAANDVTHGFYRAAGAGARDLGAPFQIQNSEAYAVSNARRIVGIAYNDPFGITYGWFLRTPGGKMQLLADLGAGSGWAFTSPSAINDLGQVAGTGQHGGLPRGFLLTPSSSEQAASLKSFALGGSRFHKRISSALGRALSDLGAGRRSHACGAIVRLAAAAAHERSLSKPARTIFGADLRGFRRSLACPGA